MKKPSKLKMARIEAGLSQDELACRCGVCRTTIHDAEKGDRLPSGDVMMHICKALGKTLDDLFWEDKL
jgi:putative transcriptional regulator